MPENPILTLDKMFEYNLWANLTVMEICRELSDEQLSFEVAGAYGGIRHFLRHIVTAETYYVFRMTGTALWDDDLNWDNLPVATILERAQVSGQSLIDIASKVDPTGSHQGIDDDNDNTPFTYYNWTLLTQALMHGVEHRTHVKVLLTHLGIPHGDLSAWDYVIAHQ